MAVVHSDTFTEAADTAITSHTPDVGSGYTIQINTDPLVDPGVLGATDELVPALLYNAPGGTGLLITAGTAIGSAEYSVSLVLAGFTTTVIRKGVMAVARYQDANNYYVGCTYNPANTADKKIVKCVGGVFTELASGDSDLAAGDTLKFECLNATKKLYVNNVELLSTSDNSITAEGKAGIGWGNVVGISGDEVGDF